MVSNFLGRWTYENWKVISTPRQVIFYYHLLYFLREKDKNTSKKFWFTKNPKYKNHSNLRCFCLFCFCWVLKVWYWFRFCDSGVTGVQWCVTLCSPAHVKVGHPRQPLISACTKQLYACTNIIDWRVIECLVQQYE